ncbi:MAG: PadR family transcriptional regulator [Candidatus Wallbacteria bacterium]|nr:PadR family transcriptional regulator [Candidatus Wallbacteria bacterium]
MNIQFKKGVLEMCVLSLLASQDCYGYELVQEISKRIEIAIGTIYPLLNRLKRENYFENYLSESGEGPPRKYYRLTPKGHEHTKNLIGEWKEFIKQVDTIIEGGNK